ncbi:MAG: pseudaminic acid cytidylyltransferase [Kiritimatiellaeota bacterium]|nr:pseudaminic acid cytidylyltransferase [Kiritimatiellota bacterium]
MNCIAIIQARGGSKRIPGKNVKPFLGKPIIHYPIERALACGALFDKVIVTTDSRDIADVAESAGAEIPFIRPPELAADHAITADVMRHAIVESERIYSCRFDYACCIYATAPFIRESDIRKGLELISSNKRSSVYSVTSFPYPVFRAQKINDKGELEMMWPEYELTRSNDIPEAYHDAGQFYWLDVSVFKREKRMFGAKALPVILPRVLVQDIDSPEDWETAEVLYQVCEKRGIL